MTSTASSTRSRQIDWPSVLAAAAPFASYGLITALVALFAEG